MGICSDLHRFAPRRTQNSALPWTSFFAQELFFDRRIDNVQIRHHAYLSPPVGSGPLFVTHHGAGSSGLSFATFTTEIQKALPDAGVLSIDARGHGQTTTTAVSSESSDTPNPAPLDLTLETLSSDLSFVLQSTLPHLPQQTPPPPIILIGHSLGGAVITHIAANTSTYIHPPLKIQAHIVLDVVEGSALDALSSMTTYLSTRPKAFPTLSSAISWHLASHTLRNPTSAAVSVPGLVHPTPDPTSPSTTLYTWTTDLASTQPFWETWFTSLSAKFLAAPSAKLLVLAGTDRLDKPLTVAQMQGKYQLHVVPDAGHFVHEDRPAEVAETVALFCRRNDRTAMVLPLKVDELIRLGKVKGVVVAAKETEGSADGSAGGGGS